MSVYRVPYLHERIPSWSDTDAAQIVYTVRFVDFAMEAIEGWFRHVMQLDWYKMNTELDMGTPFVKIEMDIKCPLTPNDRLETCVLVENMGRSSLAFDVVGRRNGDELCFESKFVCSMVQKSTMRSMSIPPKLRQNVVTYMAECDALTEQGSN